MPLHCYRSTQLPGLKGLNLVTIALERGYCPGGVDEQGCPRLPAVLGKYLPTSLRLGTYLVGYILYLVLPVQSCTHLPPPHTNFPTDPLLHQPTISDFCHFVQGTRGTRRTQHPPWKLGCLVHSCHVHTYDSTRYC